MPVNKFQSLFVRVLLASIIYISGIRTYEYILDLLFAKQKNVNIDTVFTLGYQLPRTLGATKCDTGNYINICLAAVSFFCFVLMIMMNLSKLL